MDQIPPWLKLLRAWQARGKRGLTLPFLVGAQARHSQHVPPTLTSARAVLDEIAGGAIPGAAVEVDWCVDLKVPILRLTDSPEPRLQFSGHLKQRLECDEPGEIVRRLLASARAPLEAGKFSRHLWPTEGWTPFSAEDLELIDQALTD